VHGAAGVSFFIKVFSEAGSVAVVSECRLVLYEASGETSTGLSDVRLMAVRAGEFVHSQK